jgi:hypothetical protein
MNGKLKPLHRGDGRVVQGALKAARKPYKTAVIGAVLYGTGKALIKKDAHEAFGIVEVSKLSTNALEGLTRVAEGGQGTAETIYARARLKMRERGPSRIDPVKDQARTQMRNGLAQKNPWMKGTGKGAYGHLSERPASAARRKPRVLP